MKKTIILDPGHGGHDSGAVGVVDVEGHAKYDVLEKNVNLKIGLLTRRYLNQKFPDDFNVFMTRHSDVFLTLQQRCDRAEEHGADLFVSIHCNAFDEVDDTVPGVTGIETYYYWEDAKRFANLVQWHMLSEWTDHKDRGVKQYRYYVIKNSIPESVLVECEFIDEMPEWLDTVYVQRNFATQIGNAVKGYFG